MSDPDRRFASVILSGPAFLPILLTGGGAAEHGETLAIWSIAAPIIAVMPIADWRSLARRIEATVPGTPPPTGDVEAYFGTDHGE